MGIVLSVIIGGALLVGALVLWNERVEHKDQPYWKGVKKGLNGAAVYGVIMVVIFAIALLSSNLATASSSRSLEAFYYDNAEVYGEALRATEDALYLELSEIGEAKLLSAENWKQSTNLSERIKEISDKYATFNKDLLQKRYWSRNLWTNWFVRQPADDVKYLKLTLE